MKKIIALTLLLALSNAFAFEVSYDTRENVRTDWVGAARDIAAKTDDRHDDTVVAFLEGVMLAVPTGQGAQVIGDRKGMGDSRVLIVPLVLEDARFEGRWKVLVETDGVAVQFFPDIRSIVIRDLGRFSRSGKGLMMIHAGYHARMFAQYPYEGEQDEQDLCSEEVRAHAMQDRILEALGGEAYRDIIENEVKRLVTVVGKNGGRLDGAEADRTEFDESLATIFGTGQSRHEKDLIRNIVRTSAMFTYLERLPPMVDKRGAKTRYLCETHKHSGVL